MDVQQTYEATTAAAKSARTAWNIVIVVAVGSTLVWALSRRSASRGGGGVRRARRIPNGGAGARSKVFPNMPRGLNREQAKLWKLRQFRNVRGVLV